ncbi:MAG: 16S rRNA (uracil(1498)-N(3))-methyltransferase [Xanthomonadaceae bacterium]|nr:16S rRNA (uracil(1498)-N(3))-methyltransferase [Xanthomonadaceae bacterium]
MSTPRRFLVDKIPTERMAITLSSEESHHAIKVLRLTEGDSVFAVDGKGSGVLGVIQIHKGSKSEVKIAATAAATKESPGSVIPVHITMAILKGDAMDFAIEKCVELGIESITPVVTDHTVVQIKKKGSESFQSRFQNISDQSLKQCERLTRMVVHPPMSLEEQLSKLSDVTVFWLSERAENGKTLSKTVLETSLPLHILSGPEGGWSKLEQELLIRSKNIIPVSLSPLILRGETSVIAAAAIAGETLRSKLR